MAVYKPCAGVAPEAIANAIGQRHGDDAHHDPRR